jgi:prepilin-type N-terminal cleavage/methylation domain-containing protein
LQTSTKNAFTLIEVLITLVIFGIVSVIATYTLISTMRSAKKIQAEAYLYSEAQALMDKVSRDIEVSAVDYEAYYARSVQGEEGFGTPKYGLYGQSFFHPGEYGWGEDDGTYSNNVNELYGPTCPQEPTKPFPDDCPTDTQPYAGSVDTDVFTHPFEGISVIEDDYDEADADHTFMNAFCESTSESCNSLQFVLQDALILINNRGDERVVYARETTDSAGDSYRLSKAVLTGTDDNGDGLINAWACSPLYTCNYADDYGPNPVDLTDADSDDLNFMPITPKNINLQEFHVFIAPLEDPYRAVGEEVGQTQPQITIVMKISLGSDYDYGLLGEMPSVTIQRTISTGVYNKLETYE